MRRSLSCYLRSSPFYINSTSDLRTWRKKLENHTQLCGFKIIFEPEGERKEESCRRHRGPRVSPSLHPIIKVYGFALVRKIFLAKFEKVINYDKVWNQPLPPSSIKIFKFYERVKRPNTHHMKLEGATFGGDDAGPSSSPIVGKKMMN